MFLMYRVELKAINVEVSEKGLLDWFLMYRVELKGLQLDCFSVCWNRS